MPAPDNRQPDELRPIRITRGFTRTAPGSVLIQAGGTTVLCTASVDTEGARVDGGQGARLAHGRIQHAARQHQPAQETRSRRQSSTAARPKFSGSSAAACGRSIDLDALGERTIALDCDVLEADGGTRTASITGAFIALVDALATIESAPTRARVPLAQCRRRQRRHRRRQAAVGSRLSRRRRRRGRYECRHDRRRPVRRSSRDRRRSDVHRSPIARIAVLARGGIQRLTARATGITWPRWPS